MTASSRSRPNGALDTGFIAIADALDQEHRRTLRAVARATEAKGARLADNRPMAGALWAMARSQCSLVAATPPAPPRRASRKRGPRAT